MYYHASFCFQEVGSSHCTSRLSDIGIPERNNAPQNVCSKYNAEGETTDTLNKKSTITKKLLCFFAFTNSQSRSLSDCPLIFSCINIRAIYSQHYGKNHRLTCLKSFGGCGSQCLLWIGTHTKKKPFCRLHQQKTPLYASNITSYFHSPHIHTPPFFVPPLYSDCIP